MSQALQLSSEQSKSVVALWHNFNQQVSKLLEQRQGIHKSISETAHGGTNGQEFAQKYLQVRVSSSLIIVLSDPNALLIIVLLNPNALGYLLNPSAHGNADVSVRERV